MKTAKNILILFSTLVGLNGCFLFGSKKEDPAPLPQGMVITVKEKNNPNKLIANATVSYIKADIQGSGSTSENGGGSTQSDGIFRKEGLPMGEYIVKVSAAGYIPDLIGKKVPVAVGTMTPEVFELEKEAVLEIGPSTLNLSNTQTTGTVFFNNKDPQTEINLTLEIPQNDQWVSISPLSLKIPPNEKKSILVTVDGKGRGFGSYNSTIVANYKLNTTSQPSKDFNVYMNIGNPNAPSVSTNAPTGITQTSADVIGNLTNIGGSTVTQRGICWSEASDPKPETNPKVFIDGGGIGPFPLTATKLKEGTTYYIRAYAINSNGTGLGNVEKFTTSITPTPPTLILNPVTNFTQTTAVLYGKITNNGGSNIKEQGFCYNTTGNPTINDKKIPANVDGNLNLSANMPDLTQGVLYYVRAYAINELGDKNVGYSNVEFFKTQIPSTPAKLTTAAATSITETSARLQGSLTELGSSPIKEHGFCWSRQNASPEITNSEKNQLGTKIETGIINYTLSGLKKGTLYYCRAYATSNEGKTSYGNIQTFITNEQGLVLYYPFNGDASDVSGNGKNAVVTAKSSNDKYNNEKSAYDLSSGTIQVQDPTVGRFVGDFTYSFQIKINASTFKGSRKVLFSKGSNGDCVNGADWSGFMVFSDPSNNSLSIYINSSDGKKDELKLCESSLLVDEWHSLVISKVGSSVKVFIDGLFISKVNTSYSTIGYGRRYLSGGTEGSLTIGGFSYQNSAEWCQNLEKSIATIDDFRIYSYGLSEAEVEELSKR
jgi:hypothetical protein